MGDYAQCDLSNPFNFEYREFPEWPMTAEEIDQYDFYFSLPEVANIGTYVSGRVLHAYKEALGKAIENKKVPLNRHTEKVPNPDHAELAGSWMHHLECTRIDDSDTCFYADAVIVAEIDIFQKKRLNAYCEDLSLMQDDVAKDHVRQWYRVRGVIDSDGRNTSIRDILIYDKRDRRRGIALSDCLIPILSKKDMDREAERILKKYHMESSVTECGRVDINMLAEHMGLKVKSARLSQGVKTKAKVYLERSDANVFDDQGREVNLYMKDSTALIDEVACGSEESERNAIAHECSHKEEHHFFYWLQRMYNENIRYLACIDGRYADTEAENTYEQWMEDDADDSEEDREMRPIDWAEWQARELSHRLLMPATQTRKKINQLIRLYHRNGESRAETYARIIPKLAEFYGVSQTAAKIRMIELGYREATGALHYLDGHYIPPYSTTSGKFDAGRSYDISEDDAHRLYLSDVTFRTMVDSGAIVFVENHFCVNSEDYVVGERLTDFARRHIDQCCLLFQISYKRNRNPYDKSALHNDEWKNDPVAVALASIPMDALLSATGDIGKQCDELPRRFGATLKYHRESRGLTQEELAWRAGISDRTIKRLENDEIDRPSQQLIAELGRVMQLKGCFTLDMMNKAACPLNRDLPEDMVLFTVVNFMYMRSKEECDRVLKANNCKPLGSQKQRKAS